MSEVTAVRVVRGGGNDWDGTWRRLFELFPTEALGLICNIPVRAATIPELPTERHRSVLPDRVFKVVQVDGGEQVVHVEIQTRPGDGFGLGIATYFTLLAARYGSAPQQVVIMAIARLDPGPLMGGPLASLVLWATEQAESLVDDVVDQIALQGDFEHQAVQVELALLKVSGSPS